MAEAQEAAAPKITIDNVEYDVSALSQQAKGLIEALRSADREIRIHEQRLTLLRIARQSIAASLKNQLDKNTPAEAGS